jgi:hypothetical protein
MRVNKTFSLKMTAEEWSSIVDTAIQDPERMRLYNRLVVLNESEFTSFADVDEWHNLHTQLLSREWQLLIDSRKLVRFRRERR